MLFSNHAIAVPNWQSTPTTRLGSYMRFCPDRFFHVAKYGWFVYIRSETLQLAGLVTQNGILGPYSDKTTAEYALDQYLLKFYR